MQVSNSVLARMQKEWGMQAIDNTTGCHIFETLSSLSWPQIIAHQGDQKIFIKQLNHSLLVKPNRSEVNMKFKLFVINTIKKVLEIESHFDGSVSFGNLGFNSILFTELANHLNDAYALAITPATFFAYKTVAEFNEHYEPRDQPVQPDRGSRATRSPRTRARRARPQPSSRGRSRSSRRSAPTAERASPSSATRAWAR